MDDSGLFLKRRLEIIGKICIAAFLVLILRLWYLQVVRGAEYTVLSQRNTIRTVRLEGIRGRIIDRNGVVLAENSPGFNILIFRSGKEAATRENWIDFLSEIGEDRAVSEFPLRRYATVKRDVGWKTVAWLSERNIYLPELSVEVYPKRFYPKGGHLAHVLGYTGEVSGREIETFGPGNYRRGDMIGKAGAEREFEKLLRGYEGGKQVLVNAYGHQIDVLAYKQPLAGNDVRLTIDYRIQEIIEREIEGRRGAIVVMDPRDGAILGMAARPVFDPNVFTGTLTGEQWDEILREPSVFTNRAFQSGYPPGSTFKIIVAAAALEEGLASPDETFECPGSYQMGSHVFRCWHARGHGRMNMKEAMVYSCNVYFYNLGVRVGIENIARYARKLGLGARTGIDLPAEYRGLMPTPAWKRQRHATGWFPGDTVNAAIGQGYVLASPLQMLVAYSAVANGGAVYRPHLLHSVISPEGDLLWENTPEVLSRLGGEENVSLLRDSLRETVRRGTGMNAATRVPSSGKTGTAQNPHGGDHAWFIGYAPSDEPVISIAVLFENAGQGSSEAAPVFRNIVRAALEG